MGNNARRKRKIRKLNRLRYFSANSAKIDGDFVIIIDDDVEMDKNKLEFEITETKRGNNGRYGFKRSAKWYELEVYKDDVGELRVVWPDNKLVSEIHPSRWGKRVM